MPHAVSLSEQESRADLARLLNAAVEASGRLRCDIARDAHIHKDALRRILTGKRSTSLGEASRILSASGVRAKQTLSLFILTDASLAAEWQDTKVGRFLEDFLTELPAALSSELADRLEDVRPRWAKGTAHRVARLLADHIDELERRDVLLDDLYATAAGGHHG